MLFPTSPEFARVHVELMHNNKITETATGFTQSYSNGPARLKIKVEFNKGANPAELRSVVAFINRVRGQLTPFTVVIPHLSEGEGVATASPHVLANASNGYVIRLKNLPHSTLIRRAGDLIQHVPSGNVYMLVEDLISDENGQADANIATPLLAPIAANDDIKITDIEITVRLGKDSHKYSYESRDVRSLDSLTFMQHFTQ